MADEERPPAPPIRVASTKDSVSPASKPLPSAPEKKKTKAFTFFQNKGDERSMLFLCFTAIECVVFKLCDINPCVFLRFDIWQRSLNIFVPVDYKKKPEISLPTQFEHTIHVGFDPVTGEFTVSVVTELRRNNCC